MLINSYSVIFQFSKFSKEKRDIILKIGQIYWKICYKVEVEIKGLLHWLRLLNKKEEVYKYRIVILMI